MKIEFSTLTNKIYIKPSVKQSKFDITDEVIKSLQILMLENEFEPKVLVSKLSGKEYKLSLNEIKDD